MNQREIREILVSILDNYSSKVVRELQLGRGEVIADVVEIDVGSKELKGYEIKSDRDNLSRFSKQLEVYEKTFDYNYLVVGRKYKDIEVPRKWGLIVVDGIDVEIVKEAERNYNIEKEYLLSLLWKNELVSLMGVHPKARYMNRKQLGEYLSNTLPLDVLHDYVIDSLYSREKWKEVI